MIIPFKPFSKIRILGAILKASINNPEETIKARNRLACDAINSGDLAWQPIGVDNSKNDHRLLERICDAYILSKKDQPKSGSYAVKGMWKQILNSQYGQMISTANNKDITRLGSILENVFRKNSLGLSMSGDMPVRLIPGSVRVYLNNYVDSLLRLASFVNIRDVAKDMDNDRYIFASEISARTLWKKICARVGIDSFYPIVGKPFGLLYLATNSKCVIPSAAFRHLYTATRAHELIGNAKDTNIVEIGGGFGGIIYYLFKLFPKNKRINLESIDIPEINIISSYFLSKALPDIPVRFYGETKPPASKQRRISVLPNWALKDIASDSVSLVINEDSFPEIPSNTLMEYLKRIADVSQYFYSVNQDCGKAGQNRLSQVKPEQFGLQCLSYNISWMRHGYFERVYRSIKNT